MFTHFNTGSRTSRKKNTSQSTPHFLDTFTQQSNHNNLFFQLEPQHKIFSESESITTKDFKRRMKKCLMLLKQKAPNYYGLFCLFNITIRATNNSETSANFETHTIDLPTHFKDRSDEAIAAVLIHETIHFWQQESGCPHFGTEKHNWQDGNMQKCELEAIQYELNVLRQIGAADEDIKYQEKQRGTHDGFIRFSPG